MKLMVTVKPFTAELKSVLPAIATRSGLPILSGIRLEASDGDVSIEATDLELTARRVIHGAVTVDGAGSIVVPAKALVKAVAAMGDPEIVLESHLSDGQAGLDVRAGTRTVSLQGLPSDDWPAVPQMAAIDPIASIEASAVVDAFERVALCTSDDEARPVLTCVALFFRDDPAALEVVATDSYRLGVARLPLEAGFRVSDGPLLVPARGIRFLARQLKRAEGAVQVRVLEASAGEPSRASRIAFGVPDAEWTVRTVEGEFPSWKQLVPNPEGGSFEFDPEELGSALRAATSVRSTKGAPVRLTLDRPCSLALKDPDVGEMREALTGAKFSPNGAGGMEVAFNPEYLVDAVRFCGAERGRMWVRDGLKPALFEGPERRYVLMPIRLP
jgi:DNA polymerase III subunit beta